MVFKVRSYMQPSHIASIGLIFLVYLTFLKAGTGLDPPTLPTTTIAQQMCPAKLPSIFFFSELQILGG